MKNLVRFFSFQLGLIVLSLGFSLSVSAQTPKPTATPETIDTSKTVEVRLPVTVKDKKKNLVAGLSKGDISSRNNWRSFRESAGRKPDGITE